MEQRKESRGNLSPTTCQLLADSHRIPSGEWQQLVVDGGPAVLLNDVRNFVQQMSREVADTKKREVYRGLDRYFLYLQQWIAGNAAQ